MKKKIQKFWYTQPRKKPVILPDPPLGGVTPKIPEYILRL